MPAERLPMRKIREVLRLRHSCGASVRTIAQSVGVGHTTVAEYLRRTVVIGLTWPLPAEMDDAELERRLFTPAGFYTAPTRAMPDWNHVHAELRRRGITLLLLWEEYRAEHADGYGYGYSRFCGLYIGWRRGVSATMRQTHVAGEKLFVDYAGDTVAVFDGVTGEERPAHVFVAVLGASNYTYAEARWSEGLAVAFHNQPSKITAVIHQPIKIEYALVDDVFIRCTLVLYNDGTEVFVDAQRIDPPVGRTILRGEEAYAK